MDDTMKFMMQLMEERARGAEKMGQARPQILEAAKDSAFKYAFQHKPGHFNQWVMTTEDKDDPKCIALSIGYPCDRYGYPEVFMAEGKDLFLEEKKGEFSSDRWDASEEPVQCENLEDALRVLRETSNALLGLPNPKDEENESEGSYEEPEKAKHPKDQPEE